MVYTELFNKVFPHIADNNKFSQCGSGTSYFPVAVTCFAELFFFTLIHVYWWILAKNDQETL